MHESELRRRAEERLPGPQEGGAGQDAADLRLLHELQVHKVELELINEELALREARYRGAIETSVDGFWIANAQGRLLEVNDTYVRQSGYSREELLGMPISALEARESPEEVAARARETIRKGYDRFESEHRRKDASVWPVEIVVRYGAAFDLFFVFVKDCTERRRAEKQMIEHRQELEELQRRQVAAHTAAAFAHEINQPLWAIALYAETALRMLKAGDSDPSRLREPIEQCREHSLRAGKAIREMLDVLNGGGAGIEPFDLNAEVRCGVEIARTEMTSKCRTELKLGNGLPLVRANRMHLQKVLLNLLHNGIEAMQDAGMAEPTAILSVRTWEDKGLAHVTVRDNGPGIGWADSDRLFEPFFTTKKRGIGMGLAISRSLIAANGGRLWCDSGEVPGATFHLTLPFAS